MRSQILIPVQRARNNNPLLLTARTASSGTAAFGLAAVYLDQMDPDAPSASQLSNELSALPRVFISQLKAPRKFDIDSDRG